MSLTREQAIALLEPIWIGLLSSQLRAESMLEALPYGGAADALREAAEILSAVEYIAAKGRQLSPSFLLQVFQTAKGKMLAFPNVHLSDEDIEAAQCAWLDRNPKLKAELEARRAGRKGAAA